MIRYLTVFLIVSTFGHSARSESRNFTDEYVTCLADKYGGRDFRCERLQPESIVQMPRSLADVLPVAGVPCSNNTHYFLGNGVLIDSPSCRGIPGINFQKLIDKTLSATQKLLSCFSERYPQKGLDQAVKNVSANLVISCSNSPPLKGVKAESIKQNNEIKLYRDGLKEDPFGLEWDLTEAIVHEFFHLANVENLPDEVHAQGDSIRLQDRVYSCARLCAKPGSQALTREECDMCLSYPQRTYFFGVNVAPKKSHLCASLISQSDLKQMYDSLGKASSRECNGHQQDCDTLAFEAVDRLLAQYPADVINRANLLSIKRNYQISALERRGRSFCTADGNARSPAEFPKILQTLAQLEGEIKNLDAEAGMARRTINLPEVNRIDDFCTQIHK